MTDKELWEKSQVWDSSDDGRGKLKILESVEKFADLIRADERNRAMRENASKVCKDEGDDGWSDWVCPDPKGYLMKCCDCGLIHEAEFGVVRYKSETEREDCDMVNDPNLQAVFRMRRSEQWSPKDTAYRPGGMAQPEQEPVAWVYPEGLEALKSGRPWTAYGSSGGGRIPLYLNDAVAPKAEPRSGESGAGFESLPASPTQQEKNT